MFRNLRRKTTTIFLLAMLATSALWAAPSKEHNLTDAQMHAFMGIITGFILNGSSGPDDSSEPEVTPKELALTKIQTYAKTDGKSLKPTLQDYVDAEVATAEKRLIEALNDTVADMPTRELNSTTLQQIVTTLKSMPPVLTLIGDANLTLEAGVEYQEMNATAIDAIDGVVQVSIFDTAEIHGLGSYTIVYTATDEDNNTATVERNITIVDTTPPVIELLGDALQTVALGTPYAELNATATDSYEGNLTSSIVVDSSMLDMAHVGEYSVIYSVKDSSDNNATAVRRVKVVDLDLPTIALNGEALQTIEVGSTYEELGATVADNYDKNLTSSIVIDSSMVDMALLGEYNVTYNVTDSSGNKAVEVVRSVKVVDLTLPTIALNGDALQTIEVGSSYEELGAIVADNYDKNLTSSIVIDSSLLDMALLGEYNVTYNVTDSSGNKAEEVVRSIKVTDGTPPVITLLGSDPQTLELGATYTELGATATDSYEGNITSNIIIDSASIDMAHIGEYNVTYSVADSSDNNATVVVRRVQVADSVSPLFVSESNNSVQEKQISALTLQATDASNDILYSITGEGSESFDINATTGVVTFKTPPVYIESKIYTFTAVATDGSGNEATQEVRLNIMDDGIPNNAPQFNNTAPVYADQYTLYEYVPEASDENNDSLIFSIQNKPSWAEFDPYTGKLSGTPTDAAGSANIIISVTDGEDSISLPPFDIAITPAQDIAYLFGKATQGTDKSYYYYADPHNAIDNNDSTNNHTRDGSNGENWLQVELPNPTKVFKIIIQSTPGNAGRLENAKVYISNTPYTGTVDENSSIKTLETTNKEQIITLDTPITGRYLLIRGEQRSEGGRHLHLIKVEVYGEVPAMPEYAVSFPKKHYLFGLKPHAETGTKVGIVAAVNYAHKLLNYSIVGDAPFEIDENGVITCASLPSYNRVQNYQFEIKVDDGNKSSVADVEIKLLSGNGVKQERWNNVDGRYMRDIFNSDHYNNDAPDETKIVDSFDMDENRVNSFAQKMTAVLRPEVSGKYIFAIIGDDATQLNLNNSRIASKGTYGNYKDWKDAGKSRNIMLDAGNLYPIVALLKESGGAEQISVGWKKFGDANFTLIPSSQLFLEVLDSENVKPIFAPHTTAYTIKSANSVGDKVVDVRAFDSQGDNLVYSITGEVPFSVDENGKVTISGSLEQKIYSFDVQVSDGVNTVTTHLDINSTANTAGINEAKDAFYAKARAFAEGSSVDELVESYLAYAHLKAQYTYDEFMQEDSDPAIWRYIENNPTIKEGLYASRFPANPFAVKNLAKFREKWREDGKDDTFMDTYKGVALGLAINAREGGIENELFTGDTRDHPTIDYRKLPQYEEKEQQWKDYNEIRNLGYGISSNDFRKYLKIKYNLSEAEADAVWRAGGKYKKIIAADLNIETINYVDRKKHKLSFDALNLYRLTHDLERADCYADGNPCQKIEAYVAAENNATITNGYILGHFKEYRDKLGLIDASNKGTWSLRGELGIIPKEKNNYMLMSFYDLANWKIANDQIPAKVFNDNSPDWPIFQPRLSTLPWQLLALEQSAQKQECEYVKSRFFETDESKLLESYPPNAIDGGRRAKRRYILYTTYTWAYGEPEVIFAESDWSSNRTVYRILQDGGVCGRQSTMGQHVNECLNRPSIGVGQPGHRAWVGVYGNRDNAQQYQADIGYQAGSRESAVAFSEVIYNHYTSTIRDGGLERFAGLVAGVSPASSGEHGYNQSMIMQHIGKLLEEEESSAEAVLKKSLELSPQNVDSWYQLALYYASLDQPEKLFALVDDFTSKRDSFFLEDKSRKGAENMELVTAKNIIFTVLRTPSVDEGKGDRAEWAMEKIWTYLENSEKEDRSVKTYRNQNRYLSKYYLEKKKDEEGFGDAIETLFARLMTKGASGGHYSDYFRGVEFGDINKTKLFDRLQILANEAQISEQLRDVVYEDILGRTRSLSLASITVDDICLEANLSSCQSLKTFELDAKEIYMITDKRIGEDKEIDPTKQGQAGYSVLTLPIIDDEGKEFDVKLRVAKIATAEGVAGKLLKINDPSEVATDKTTVVVWLDAADNSEIVAGRRYEARQRVVLKVKKRVTNNEESMGSVVLNIKDLIRGHRDMLFNGEALKSITYDDNTTSIYFTVLDEEAGPTKGVWWPSGYNELTIKVKDDAGSVTNMVLRASNGGLKMNGAGGEDWKNILKLVYDAEDNPTLTKGTHYKSVLPLAVDARMWHKGNKAIDRMYIEIDMVVK